MSELFLEIRCEELPARFLEPARTALDAGVRNLLKGIHHGGVHTWATPRRLAVSVFDVALHRPEEEKLITGPPAASGMKDGKPTPAAEGFARKFGADPSALEVVDGPKGQVLALRVRGGGEKTSDQVAAGLEAMILAIPFPKSMRWGSGRTRWGRPLHGVVALLGGQRIPATVAGLETVDWTIGHRLFPEAFQVAGSETWLEGLLHHKVEPDPDKRRQRIRGELAERAAELGCTLKEMPDLLAEVVNLVEWPVVVVGTIDESLLALPPRLLVESMKVHQRVFPLFRDGRLHHDYLVVTNNPHAISADVAATISEGNTRVLAARFYDARHFYAEDKKHRLEARWPTLEGMGWIRKGGTMADKGKRLVALSGRLASAFGADPDAVRRAALLAKCDLATLMVGEFPELQGHVGRLLAAHQGEPETVSLAIEEHYLPRFAGDAPPSTAEGRALAAADRLDTLVGCFALDHKPKGSADPLGLRRAANGLLQLLEDARVRQPLSALFEEALRVWRSPDDPETAALGPADATLTAELVEFTLTRLRAQLQELAPTEFVDAVFASGDKDALALRARLMALHALSRSDSFGPLKSTFKRVMGLTRDHGDPSYDLATLDTAAERALHDAISTIAPRASALAETLAYDEALALLATLKAPVDQLFDAVMVMCEDATLRRNRLGLLRATADAFRRVADFTHLSSEAG